MLFDTFLLPGVIVPAVAAAVVFGFHHGLTRASGASGADRSSSRGGSVGGLAVAVALFAASVAMTGWPRFPPIEASQRLLFAALVIGVLAWGVALWRGNKLPWIVRVILFAATLGLLLQSQVVHQWSPLTSTLWLLGLLTATLAVDFALTRGLRTDRDAPPTWGLGDIIGSGVPMALVGGTALALGLSGSARLAQLTGAVACAMLTLEVLGRLVGRRPWRIGDGAPLTAIVAGLLIIGFFYAELAVLPALLLLTAFLLLALPTASAWVRLFPLVPFAIALGIVIVAAMNQEDDPYDYYGNLDPSHTPHANERTSGPIAS